MSAVCLKWNLMRTKRECRNYFIVRIMYLEFRIDLYICGHDVEFEYTLSTISVPVLFGFVSLLLNSVHQ